MENKNVFNESLKGDRKFAGQVKNTYNKILREWTIKARGGNEKACGRVMELLVEKNVVLYHLGFRTGDTDKLIKIK